MAVLYNSVHFSLMILLLCAKANDQKSWACLIIIRLTIYNFGVPDISSKDKRSKRHFIEKSQHRIGQNKETSKYLILIGY